MSGNERKRQKRGDQKEESRRKSGDASDNVANSENTTSSISHPHLPKLPAVVWGKHIAPFLHRKDLNNLLAQGGKEIYDACKDLKFPWPTVELHLSGVYEVDGDSSEVQAVLRAITPDSKWIIAAPVTSKRENGTFLYCFTGLHVFHARYGRSKNVVHLPGRPSSSSPRKTASHYYPKQISISKDGRYLTVSYEEKIEVDVFRITFHEESKAPSVSLELHRTFELESTTATSPFKLIRRSCRFVLSTNSKWLIVGYMGDIPPGFFLSPSSAVVAWNIETGALVKSEQRHGTLHPIHDEIVATDSMILWRQNTGDSPIAVLAWTIENDELSREEEPIRWTHPDNDVARRKLYCFRKLTPSPVDSSTFIVVAEETQDSQGPFSIRHPLDLLKLIPSTEQGVSTTIKKLRRLDNNISHFYACMSIGWYPDCQHCLLFDYRSQSFKLKDINEENTHCATPCIRREELVDKANVISQWGMQAVDQALVQDFELSPDGEFLTLQVRDYSREARGRHLFVVSHNCGNALDEIKGRLM